MPPTEFQPVADRDLPVDAASDATALPAGVRPHIDGGPAGGSGPELRLLSPVTGAPVARVACAGPEDIERAVDSASRAWSVWRRTPFRERAERLHRLATSIHEQRHSIAQLISTEQGKPLLEALTLEVIPALDHLRFIVRHAEHLQSGQAVETRHPFYTHKHAHSLYDPIGVVASVTPSPMPFAIPLVQTAAALAMGNAVVLKPSERTPLSGLRVGELCAQAGFPAGLVNVVPALPEHAMHLILHPRVEKVFVTGSLDAGQSIMAMSGVAVRPVVLSLGGKHPSIVAGDADVERAARGIVWGALANAGQNCGAVERVYVEERAASRFMDALLAEVDRVRVGAPMESGTDMGPLLSRERREAVHAQVEDAVQQGGKIVRGGELPTGPGSFYPPTVVLDPPNDCRLMQNETLGPVIPVVFCESLERAMMLADQSDYALCASGWTRSTETAERLMVGLRAGVVTINDVLYSFGEPASTWSGHGKSGLGQNHGAPGLREMSRRRFVSFDPSASEAPLFAFPYDDRARSLADSAMDYLNNPGRFGRLRALWRLVRMKRFRRRTPLRDLLGAARGRS